MGPPQILWDPLNLFWNRTPKLSKKLNWRWTFFLTWVHLKGSVWRLKGIIWDSIPCRGRSDTGLRPIIGLARVFSYKWEHRDTKFIRKLFQPQNLLNILNIRSIIAADSESLLPKKDPRAFVAATSKNTSFIPLHCPWLRFYVICRILRFLYVMVKARWPSDNLVDNGVYGRV